MSVLFSSKDYLLRAGNPFFFFVYLGYLTLKIWIRTPNYSNIIWIGKHFSECCITQKVLWNGCFVFL